MTPTGILETSSLLYELVRRCGAPPITIGAFGVNRFYYLVVNPWVPYRTRMPESQVHPQKKVSRRGMRKTNAREKLWKGASSM